MFKLIVGIAALVIIGTFAPWIFVVAGILPAIVLAWWAMSFVGAAVIGFIAEVVGALTAAPPEAPETPRTLPTQAGPQTWVDIMPIAVVGTIVLGYVVLIAIGP